MNLNHNKTYIFLHIILAIFVLLCFRSGINNFFAGDDFGWLFIAIKTIHHPFYIFKAHHYFLEAHNHYIRFTELVYFIVNIFIAGDNPILYHLTAILIHMGNVVLVSYFLSRLCRNRLAGLLGALFWGLHYKHTEVVFRPYGVADSLVLLFCLGAFFLFLHNRQLLAAISFVIGLFAKESAIVFPFLLTVYVFWFIKTERKTWIKRTIPLWIIASLFAVLVRYVGEPNYISIDRSALSRFWELILTYIGPDAFYVKQVWLAGKSSELPAWVAGILFVVLAIGIWKLPKIYGFGMLWITIMMVPTLFIGHQTSRYYYLPLVGLGIIVGHGVSAVLTYCQKRNLQMVILGIVTLFILLMVYYVIGINLEEQDYAFYGEIHRQAAESFKRNVMPTMLNDPQQMAIFFKYSNKKWIEELDTRYTKFLSSPWYFPGTYKWLYVRPSAILGLSNTYGFVSYCAYNDIGQTLFVNIPYDEFQNRLSSGDFYVITYDDNTNTFGIGPEMLKHELTEHKVDRVFYRFFQPGHFDPTNTGTPFF